MTFATGFGTGLLVLPLTFLCSAMLGGAAPAVVVFAALTAGAMLMPPSGGEPVAGVLSGIVATVVCGFALVSALLAGVTFG